MTFEELKQRYRDFQKYEAKYIPNISTREEILILFISELFDIAEGLHLRIYDLENEKETK